MCEPVLLFLFNGEYWFADLGSRGLRRQGEKKFLVLSWGKIKSLYQWPGSDLRSDITNSHVMKK